MLLADRCTKGIVDSAETVDCLTIAKQVHDPRMLLQRRGYHDEQLPARSQPGQAGFEIGTERIQLGPRE